jgi:small multidrug resistance pump
MSAEQTTPQIHWHGPLLKAAATYNLLWGCFAIFFPLTLFRWCGVDPLPNYPELWQCIGMIVGVYGVGYWIAAADAVRHWPVVFVGLLGKVLGPIGFVHAVSNERLPLQMGITIIFNDLIWWVPFAMLLLHARRRSLVSEKPLVVEEPPELAAAGKRRRSGQPVVVWSSLKSAPLDVRQPGK